MCGRLSQYSGIHDFVAALSMPNTLISYAGDQPFELYNAAPTTQLALFHQEGQFLRADMVRWGWRPHWAKDRAAPINARVEKVAHGAFFKAIWPHRAIIAINNWFEWVDESGPKKQPENATVLSHIKTRLSVLALQTLVAANRTEKTDSSSLDFMNLPCRKSLQGPGTFRCTGS